MMSHSRKGHSGSAFRQTISERGGYGYDPGDGGHAPAGQRCLMPVSVGTMTISTQWPITPTIFGL